jgi:hypothetical protein
MFQNKNLNDELEVKEKEFLAYKEKIESIENRNATQIKDLTKLNKVKIYF